MLFRICGLMQRFNYTSRRCQAHKLLNLTHWRVISFHTEIYCPVAVMPKFVNSLKSEAVIEGIAFLGDKLFVVKQATHFVSVYNVHSIQLVSEVVNVELIKSTACSDALHTSIRFELQDAAKLICWLLWDYASMP